MHAIEALQATVFVIEGMIIPVSRSSLFLACALMPMEIPVVDTEFFDAQLAGRFPIVFEIVFFQDSIGVDYNKAGVVKAVKKFSF